MSGTFRPRFPLELAFCAVLLMLPACERGATTGEDDKAQSAATEQPAPDTHSPAAYGEPSPHLVDGIREHLLASGDSVIPPFRFALIDLNNDTRDEAIVLLEGGEWCGSGGCTMLVFRGDDEGSLLVSSTTSASGAIRVATSRTAGWRDLIVRAERHGDVTMRLGGNGYPANASSQPVTAAAAVDAAERLPMLRATQPGG